MSTIVEGDITASLDRLANAFRGNYGSFPIQEGERKVGMLTFDPENKRVYVTYRGSVNSLFEPLSCLFIWKKNVERLEGKAHAGLYAASQKTIVSFQEVLKKSLESSQIPQKEIHFVVEGYSRGSALAVLTALFLKQNFPENPLDVLTYSSMRIFDRVGAENYTRLIGSSHWSFLCQEDPFPQWLGPSFFGFHPTGQQITFSAQDSPKYHERVKANRYTYLIRIPLISWCIKKIISCASWEAHMPGTYQELAPLSFQKSSRLHTLSS